MLDGLAMALIMIFCTPFGWVGLSREPSIAPLLWSIIAATTGFLLCVIGGNYFYDEWRLLGAAFFVLGSLLACFAILPWGFL